MSEDIDARVRERWLNENVYNKTEQNDQKSPIELTENFIVTYNCHKDEYTINGDVEPGMEGWKRYANQSGNFERSVITKNRKEKWRIVKTKRSAQKISWVFSLDKLPEASKSQKFFIFVNSSTKGKGDVLWTLTRDKLATQLSPRVINEIQLNHLVNI